jgi:hypothetical protein
MISEDTPTLSCLDPQWKKADNPNEAHDVSEIIRFTEDDMDEAIEKAKLDQESEDSDSENDDVAGKVKASRINHEDLFNEERGRARLAEGDDGYEEEMGGQSQMMHVATAMACENFDSASDTGEEDFVENNVQPSKLKPVLHPVKEEVDIEQFSDKSSAAAAKDASKKSGLGGIVASRSHTVNENASSLSLRDTPPVIQPSNVANQNGESLKPKSRSKVSIMGVVFEETNGAKAQKKKPNLYIPSYSRAKKS